MSVITEYWEFSRMIAWQEVSTRHMFSCILCSDFLYTYPYLHSLVIKILIYGLRMGRGIQAINFVKLIQYESKFWNSEFKVTLKE